MNGTMPGINTCYLYIITTATPRTWSTPLISNSHSTQALILSHHLKVPSANIQIQRNGKPNAAHTALNFPWHIPLSTATNPMKKNQRTRWPTPPLPWPYRHNPSGLMSNAFTDASHGRYLTEIGPNQSDNLKSHHGHNHRIAMILIKCFIGPDGKPPSN